MTSVHRELFRIMNRTRRPPLSQIPVSTKVFHESCFFGTTMFKGSVEYQGIRDANFRSETTQSKASFTLSFHWFQVNEITIRKHLSTSVRPETLHFAKHGISVPGLIETFRPGLHDISPVSLRQRVHCMANATLSGGFQSVLSGLWSTEEFPGYFLSRNS